MSKLASYLCVNISRVHLSVGTRRIYLSGFIVALALSAHAASPPPQPQHETLCAYSMRATDAWQPVPHAKDAGLQRVPTSPEPMYYRQGSTVMVVYCAPRFEPDFGASVAREVSAVSHSYTSFAVLGNDHIQFQKAPAQWFLFNGALKLKGTLQDGYMMVADRGDRSLVIAISAEADPNHEYSELFRSTIQLFSLQ